VLVHVNNDKKNQHGSVDRNVFKLKEQSTEELKLQIIRSACFCILNSQFANEECTQTKIRYTSYIERLGDFKL
jgi:hypothetical protein